MVEIGGPVPSADQWLAEAKTQPEADRVGMYLVHNGVVRGTARAAVRQGAEAAPVRGMLFFCDRARAEAAAAAVRELPGIYTVRVWVNDGLLQVGDELMRILVGGDIRPRVTAALDLLITRIKQECVTEQELYETEE